MKFLFIYFLAMPCSLWDFSSPPATEPGPLAVRTQSPNHWATKKVPEFFILNLISLIPRIVAQMYILVCILATCVFPFVNCWYPIFFTFLN